MKKNYNDFGTFKKMREAFPGYFTSFDLKEREVNRFFENYIVKLGFLLKLAMKTKKVELLMKTWESKVFDNVVYSQFDLDPGTQYYMDFTFMIKPAPSYDAPFIHGDILMPMAGVKGLFHMDFYCFNPREYDIEQFFGQDMDKITKALQIVQKYQKIDDRGKLTKHLDQYKSRFRIELKEPQKATEAERKAYFDASYECFDLTLRAYCSAMSRRTPVQSTEVMDRNVRAMQDFVSILFKKDIAIRLGKMMFNNKEVFNRYFLNAFWRTELPPQK